MGIHLEEEGLTFARIERRTPDIPRSSRIRAPCLASTEAGTEEEEGKMARLSP